MKGTSLHIASPITQMSCNIIWHEQNYLACEFCEVVLKDIKCNFEALNSGMI